MKKKITSLVLCSLLIAITLLVLLNGRVIEAADNVFLLENRHPGYWNYLSPYKMAEVETIPELDEIPVCDIRKNNLLSELTSGEYSGITVTNSNGILSIKGKALDNIWLSAGKELLNLDKGSYLFSIGNYFPKNASIYAEGISKNKDYNYQIFNLQNNRLLCISNEIDDDIKITIEISKGMVVDFSIEPIIFKFSDQDESSQIEKIAVWERVPKEKIANDDLMTFNNYLPNYSKYKSCNILYSETEGIAYYKKEQSKIRVDELKRIHINPIGEDNDNN